ncbi:MAG: rRNA maturation RNase YbeY [Oscillospiraceae bacterium]|nr:rRNA maturation RNase YbeY [Oscillospiraceae bacterium]
MLDIVNVAGGPECKKYAKDIRRAIRAALKFEGVDLRCEVNVELSDDCKIQKLNREYRGKDSSTDVLSFPLTEPGEPFETNPENGVAQLGDIIISLETAQKQSERLGQSIEAELMFLAVHATLHLLGHDHETSEEDDLAMREKQKEIIKTL